jgi:hypothetical protein
MQSQKSRGRNALRITLSDVMIMTTPVTTTLLDLISALQDCTPNDVEVVATIVFLINSGRVRLCGIFAGARIDVAPVTETGPFSSPSLLDGLRDSARQLLHGAGPLRRLLPGGDPVSTQRSAEGNHCGALQHLLPQKHRARTLLVPQ